MTEREGAGGEGRGPTGEDGGAGEDGPGRAPGAGGARSGPADAGAPERDRPRHPVRVAAERTGLSPHLLRMWERRYGVVEPARSGSGQRLYTDAEVERLRLLHRATIGGRSIGGVAELDDEELVELIREDEQGRARAPREGSPAEVGTARAVEAALEAAGALDEDGLERVLRRAAATAGLPRFLEEVAAPLLRELGERWHAGEVGPAEEHLASAVVRRVVETSMADLGAAPDAPIVVVATPAGERHEIGALLAATAARAEGWRVRYLGADLPAAEIADAVRRTGARAVGLSVVDARGRDAALEEVGALRVLLPDTVTVLVGGAAVGGWRDALVERGVVPVDGLAGLRAALPGTGEPGEG